MISAWALQIIGNGLSAAAPAYGFNVYSAATAPQGWALVYGSLSCWLIAAAFVKTAFTATLLRLSSGRTKIILWLIVPIVWGFSIPAAVVAWLDICEISVSISIKTACISRATYLWIMIGNSVSTLVVDLLLAYLPWQIISRVHLPGREKWAVSMSMSLTLLSFIVCLIKYVFLIQVVWEMISKEQHTDSGVAQNNPIEQLDGARKTETGFYM